MCKKIMILGASELQVPAIEKAKELGIKSIVVDYDKNAIGIKDADIFYNISTLDYEKVLEVAKNEKIDGILTICSDKPMNVVAKVSETLSLNAIPVQTALLATNKAHMRNALKKGDVPIPKYAICKTKEEYMKAVETIGLPFIVKPSDNSGSRGIMFVNNKEMIMSAYDYSSENSLENVVLVEEYMYGKEVSVEVFTVDNTINVIQITDKITTGAPHFVEMGHTQPSELGIEIQEEIRTVTASAIKALGITGGPAHVELKITDDGVKIVELGARLGGDFIATNLVSASTGVDLVKETINWTLGEKIDIKRTEDRYSAIRYIGKLKAIRFEKETLALLDEFRWTKNDLLEINSSRDRECSFIVSADSKENLTDKIEKIRELLTYEDESFFW